MACLRLKHKKYWIKAYVNGKETWLKTGTGDKATAQQKLRDYETSVATGAPSPFPSKTPLTTTLQAYCLHLDVTLTRDNYIKYISKLRTVFGPICPALESGGKIGPVKFTVASESLAVPHLVAENIEQIDTPAVTSFLDKCHKFRNVGIRTRNSYREIINRFCNWATGQSGVRFPKNENPVASAKQVTVKIEKPIIYLKKEQVCWLLGLLVPWPQMQAMVATLIYAGLRRSELLWLRQCDIVRDTAGRPIEILVRKKTVDGKPWGTKTKKDRTVPISKALAQYLMDFLKEGEDDWLFPSPWGRRWDKDVFSSTLKKTIKEAYEAITPEMVDMKVWTCGEFRHTFGTILAAKGESVYDISKLMGNSPKVCEKYYLCHVPSVYAEVVDFDESRRPRVLSSKDGLTIDGETFDMAAVVAAIKTIKAEKAPKKEVPVAVPAAVNARGQVFRLVVNNDRDS